MLRYILSSMVSVMVKTMCSKVMMHIQTNRTPRKGNPEVMMDQWRIQYLIKRKIMYSIELPLKDADLLRSKKAILQVQRRKSFHLKKNQRAPNGSPKINKMAGILIVEDHSIEKWQIVMPTNQNLQRTQLCNWKRGSCRTKQNSRRKTEIWRTGGGQKRLKSQWGKTKKISLTC